MNETSNFGEMARSTAADFIAELPDSSTATRDKEGRVRITGVKMGALFTLAKKHMTMTVVEIEKLLESPVLEHRVGAVSVMDWKARSTKTTEAERKALFDLYLERHNCIDDWSLVDRAAPYVVGGYLADKPRDILYQLAISKNVWERRTAITSTYYFIRKQDLQTTFAIAAILVEDPEHFVQTAVGGWLREAGKKDQAELIKFLNHYHPVMSPIMLRFAVEHLDKKQKEHYFQARKNGKDKRERT